MNKLKWLLAAILVAALGWAAISIAVGFPIKSLTIGQRN